MKTRSVSKKPRTGTVLTDSTDTTKNIAPANDDSKRPLGLFDPLLYVPYGAESWYHFPMAYTIDFCKFITPLVIVLTMYLFREQPFDSLNNPSAWAYLGTHGSYGLLWVCKGVYGYGDQSFQQAGTVLGQLVTFIMLAHYWLPIYLICSSPENPPLYSMAISIFLYGCGVYWHFSADIQKAEYIETKQLLRKHLGNDEVAKLIGNVLKTKLFKQSRNPNYFGEFLIYMSFCVMSFNPLPFATFGTFMCVAWYSFILKKEKSMARHGREFADYQSSTPLIFPRLFC